jgi:hypothetical protein
LCLCISRTVLEYVGGFDERFEFGNFEDDDFCIRVRAAGYGIFVCDSVFIHHFGSRSFAANNVDYAQTMNANWERFAAKWGYPPQFPKEGYHPRRAYARGFVRAFHHFALPSQHDQEPPDDALPPGLRLVFAAPVAAETQWSAIAEFVKRFARAFKSDDGVMLAIGAFGELGAATIAERVERIFNRAGVEPAEAGYVEITDDEGEGSWRERFAGIEAIDVATIEDRSPSALRRLASVVRV